MKLPIVQNNERPDICGPCGGRCCKRGPGIYLPHQWKSRDGIVAALKSGKCMIHHYWDWFDGMTKFVLIPSTASMYEQGQCSNLTESGCALSFEERPYGCQSMIPAGGENPCRTGDTKFMGKDAYADMWADSEFDLGEIHEEMLG